MLLLLLLHMTTVGMLKAVSVLLWHNAMLLFLLLSCILSGSPASALRTERPLDSMINTGSVHQFGGAIPTSRVHHSMVSTGNFLIVYGGYNTDGSLIDGVEIFDKASQQWSGVITRKECCNAEGGMMETMGLGVNRTLGPLMEVHEGYEGDIPLARAEHSAVVCSGGAGSSSKSSAATAAGAVGRTAGGNAMGGGVGEDSTGGGGSTSGGSINTAGLVNNTGGGGSRMYMFGGVTEEYGYMNDLYFFDAEQMRWTVVDRSITTNSGSATLPPRRAGHAMVTNVSTGSTTAGGSTNEVTEFFIFGGRGSDFNMAVVGFNDVWRYSTVTNGWTLLSNSDTSRINRNNPTPGGVKADGSGSGTTSSSYSSPFAPAPRQYAAATIVGSRLWIFGGVDPVSEMVFNDVWAFHLYTRTWVQHSANSGNVNGYAPPPLYYAHLIPLIPVPDANVLQFGQFHVNLTGVGTTPTPPPASPHDQMGFLVYGGMGVGGSCGHVVNRGRGGVSDKSPLKSTTAPTAPVCAPLESTLGQVYRLTVTLEDLTDNETYSVDSQEHGVSDGSTGVEGGNMNIHDVSVFDGVGDMRPLGAGNAVFAQNLKQDKVTHVSWDYVRIATDSWHTSSGTTGTNVKARSVEEDELLTPSTAFSTTVRTRTESVTTHSTSTAPSSLSGKYRKTYAMERIVYDYLRGVVYELGGMQSVPATTGQLANQQAATLVLHSISLDGGAGYLAPVSWDKHSGEWERFAVDTPTNYAWVYSDGFVSSQPQQEFTSVRFLHTFRAFQIASPQDMVMVLENYIEDEVGI